MTFSNKRPDASHVPCVYHIYLLVRNVQKPDLVSLPVPWPFPLFSSPLPRTLRAALVSAACLGT